MTKNALEEELEEFEIVKPETQLNVEGVERALTCGCFGEHVKLRYFDISLYILDTSDAISGQHLNSR